MAERYEQQASVRYGVFTPAGEFPDFGTPFSREIAGVFILI
jgi:hypothetical protein